MASSRHTHFGLWGFCINRGGYPAMELLWRTPKGSPLFSFLVELHKNVRLGITWCRFGWSLELGNTVWANYDG